MISTSLRFEAFITPTHNIYFYSDFLSINPYTGNITISGTVTASKSKDNHGKFLVIASDGGHKQSNMTVSYAIYDENNHAPLFVQPKSTTFKIKEVS